mmetsp:Transcript_4319/g.13466  ORF Transcript_4319/g.13466 Transcript_4319/m.13466 type:complete len:191 (+) Transcript_4319:268-840(+)|eukprot:CAMPEP_0198659502 /NCGR_PEP_ID=MMETSP1467-20131203/32255_1 /TAXON_ID=1462469 /ORGANISM="unid. sp., Strain CCMP2135" /LENGTH=190 /DNA_ID=CAMNT_0044395857 /DNA_START=147 /DNA_END=719 /DNA_ORIENTATION=+
MKAYTATFVDDEDATAEEFLEMEVTHETPAKAVAAFCDATETDNQHAETWATWLRGVKWEELKTSMFQIGLPEAHEMLNIAERSLSKGTSSPLDIPRYCFFAPGHPDLLDSLGLECDDQDTADRFTASFQQVWPHCSDTDSAVDKAIDTSLASSSSGGKGKGGKKNSKKKPDGDQGGKASKKSKTTRRAK